jgi:hypothetical protein
MNGEYKHFREKNIFYVSKFGHRYAQEILYNGS